MRRPPALLASLALTPLLLFAACGAPPDTGDAGSSSSDASQSADAGSPDAGARTLVATESYEREVDYGWIAAGQPSQARVIEVVGLGARIISLRYENEDPFDEPQVISDAGGEFTRYPTSGSDLQQVSFREGMYDLYDAEIAAGGPVYLHCASSNRVGASWALYHAERKGLDGEAAIALGQAAGLGSLESTVRSILGI